MPREVLYSFWAAMLVAPQAGLHHSDTIRSAVRLLKGSSSADLCLDKDNEIYI
jgi:hypothetical protein